MPYKYYDISPLRWLFAIPELPELDETAIPVQHWQLPHFCHLRTAGQAVLVVNVHVGVVVLGMEWE